jgi:hypothetical protein
MTLAGTPYHVVAHQPCSPGYQAAHCCQLFPNLLELFNTVEPRCCEGKPLHTCVSVQLRQHCCASLCCVFLLCMQRDPGSCSTACQGRVNCTASLPANIILLL